MDEKKDVKVERYDSPSRRGEEREKGESRQTSRQTTPVKSEEEESEARQGRRVDRGRNDSPGGKRGRGRGRGRNTSKSDIDGK